MSPKQWLALLCFYILYLLFGACVFYHYEHNKELEERAQRLQDRIKVNELLVKFASPEDEEIQNQVLERVSNYCGSPVTNYTLDEYPEDLKRTFYHSFWFTFIVCSTLGYGSSSPHDLRAQAFLIFYALFGLPLNGFVLKYLGDFFSKTFIGMYKRYKDQQYATTKNYATVKKFGLISRIIMLLVPGIAFFIFLPACIFSHFEDWPYVTSVYYSFITLTTIGFGDYVPTFQDGQARKFGIYFTFYQIFIVLWNVIGMGYFIMIIGFIAKGMQSKRIARLEHQLSMNMKSTQNKIWTGVAKDLSFLRRILNEVNLMKFKAVYTDSSENIEFNSIPRSLSCPELTMYQVEKPRISRKRTYSENYGQHLDSDTTDFPMTLKRVQSDGDLTRIDKNETCKRLDSSNLSQTQDLLSNILAALGSIQLANEDELSDSKLWSSKKTESQRPSLTLSEESGSNRPRRQRAFSDFNLPQHDNFINSNEMTWNGSNDRQIQDYLRNRPKKFSIVSIFSSESDSPNRSVTNRQTTLHVPVEGRSRPFMSKMNPFKSRVQEIEGTRNSVSTLDPQIYLNNTAKGRESLFSSSQSDTESMELLEKTTIADLIRALEEVKANSNASPLLTDFRGSLRSRALADYPNLQVPSSGSRRGSLQHVPAYTTVFTSQNISRHNNSPVLARKLTSSTQNQVNANRTAPNPTKNNLSMAPHRSPPSRILRRTFSLSPSPLAASSQSNLNTRLLPETPTITVQQPDDTTTNVLWPPESRIADRSVSELKNRSKHKRADSK